jgi:Toxin SpoIISA, type II toxin-antitoxin system
MVKRQEMKWMDMRVKTMEVRLADTKVKIRNKEYPFLLIFGVIWILVIGIVLALLLYAKIPYMSVFLGGFSLFLIGILAYYWINAVQYLNNLGLIRKTFYVLYLIFLSIGMMTGKVDYKDWKLLTELTVMIVFVDLAVFQTPNILKIGRAEFQHSDEIKKTIQESTEIILQNIKKVEKFSNVIQETDDFFAQRSLPSSQEEYKNLLEEYLKLYTQTFDFSLSFFFFPLPEDEKSQKRDIKKQIENIAIRHRKDFSEEEKENMLNLFFDGKIIHIEKNKLVAIPCYGIFYGMIITLEAKDVYVDMIDASHISNLVYVFDLQVEGANIGETESNV